MAKCATSGGNGPTERFATAILSQLFLLLVFALQLLSVDMLVAANFCYFFFSFLIGFVVVVNCVICKILKIASRHAVRHNLHLQHLLATFVRRIAKNAFNAEQTINMQQQCGSQHATSVGATTLQVQMILTQRHAFLGIVISCFVTC